MPLPFLFCCCFILFTELLTADVRSTRIAAKGQKKQHLNPSRSSQCQKPAFSHDHTRASGLAARNAPHTQLAHFHPNIRRRGLCLDVGRWTLWTHPAPHVPATVPPSALMQVSPRLLAHSIERCEIVAASASLHSVCRRQRWKASR